MKSVLILQDVLAHYRRPLFDELAKYYRVTILHSSRTARTGFNHFDEIIIPELKIGPIHLQNAISIYRIKQQFDVVISMCDLRWPAYILPFIWRCSLKWILWGHRYSSRPFVNVVRDLLLKKADRILLYSEEDVSTMIKRGVDPNKICIAPNTVYIPNHADMSGADKSSFLFVGRLQPRKRIDLLIRAFSEIQDRIPRNIVLDIVGGGLLEPQLQNLAIRLGIAKKVIFHGPVFDSIKLAGLFSRAYAYVSPGPVGLGVLHSFAYGVPVVTLRKARHGPEFQNLIHFKNSVILENESDLASALEWICDNFGTIRTLGHNAYIHYIQNRTINHMLAGFRKAIED